jgi:hypothetical protein
MKTLITSWIDVIKQAPQFFDFDTGQFKNTTKSDILDAIKKEESQFRSKLRPFYGNNLSNNVNHISTKVLNTNRDIEFTFSDSSITFINAGTQTYKITFTSETNFSIKSDFDGTFTGNVSSNTTLTDIVIKSTSWTGWEFNPNDIIYLTTYNHESILIDNVTKLSAAKMIEQVYTSEAPNTSPNATQLRQQVQDFYKIIISESAGDTLLISKQLREQNYIELGYNINKYGNDITEYEN